jgi:hypothetical protein
LEQRGSAASLVHSREVPPDPNCSKVQPSLFSGRSRFSAGATFQTPIPGVLKQAGSEHRLPFGYHQREPVGDVVRRGDARQAVRLDARDLLVCVKRGWLRGKDTFPFYYPQTVLSLAVMDPPEVAGRDQVVDMHIPQRGAVLCLVFAEQPLELS